MSAHYDVAALVDRLGNEVTSEQLRIDRNRFTRAQYKAEAERIAADLHRALRGCVGAL